MKRWLASSAVALAAVIPWVATAQAKEKAEPSIRWATTWAQAVAEARDRNAVIFATFHKDN